MTDASYWSKRLIIARRKQAYLERVRSRTVDPQQQASLDAELRWTACVVEDLQRRLGGANVSTCGHRREDG